MWRLSEQPPVLQNDPLYLKVYSLLKEWIICGKLLPGERVRETSLALELGVSRTPVRDALRRLEQDRLIAAVPGPAYEVYRPTLQDLTDLFAARAILEGGAAAAAAVRQPAREISTLTEVLDQMRHAYAGRETRKVLELDMEFHELLLTAAGNPVLVELHNHLSTRLRQVRSLSGDIAGRQSRVLEQHAAIIEAIRSGSGPAAEEATRVHIMSVYQGAREAFLEKASS